MFKNLKWLRLVPDAPGKGGTKTGFHSFQLQPLNETRQVNGFHIYRGRWRKDFLSQSVSSTTGHTGLFSVKAVHGYTYPDLTNPAATQNLTILGHHVGGGFSYYWDFTHNTARESHGAQSVPATFLNIQGRCFAADGAREGIIFDDRTAAIHTQANQNLGIGTPTQPLSNPTTGSVTPYGTGYLYYDSFYLTHPNPSNRISTIVTTDTVSFSVLNTAFGQYTGVVIVQDNPDSDAESSNTTTFSASGTISIDTNTSLVTLAGATWPSDFGYCGMAINFNGYSFVISDHGVTTRARNLNGDVVSLSNVQLLILGVYDGPTITGATYTITGCRLKMPGAPSLASSLMLTNTGTLGYSQTTNSDLVQVQVLAVTADDTFRNLGNISLGPESIDGAAIGSIESITDGTIADGRKNLTSVTAPWTAKDVGLPIFVDEASSTGGILSTTIDYFVAAGSIRLAAANTSGTDIAGTGQAWWGSQAAISDGAMGAKPDKTLTSASNPFVAGDVGQPIVVEGAGNAGGTIALITTIASFTNAGEVELTDENEAGAITGKRVWWKGVSVDTHAGPTYAYAWYDPETGHMSNISPKFQIPRPTEIGDYTDFAYITPAFQIDPGCISYPSGVDATRFSHLVFFRTLSSEGSSTLYPIGSLQPFVGKVHPGAASTRGTWNPSTYRGWMGLPNNYASIPPSTMGASPQYWYDFSSDEDLILTGGFRAPQFTNEKPMALLSGGLTQPAKVAYQAYWDRRLWIVATQEPDKIAFSCDEAQCPLGVPVESFPPTNYLRIPSVDGQVVGLKTVGDMLLVTTNRWAYTIAGNNESNYRLLRVSTRMAGVGVYQMSELTSDVEGQQSIVYFLGRDKIVYEWVPGGAVRPISAPVQDILNTKIATLTDYQTARVHCVSAWARRIVIITYQPNDGSKEFLIFDVENRVWTTNVADDGTYNPAATTMPPAAMTTIYGLNPPVNEIFTRMNNAGTAVIIRSWIRDDGMAQPLPLSTITTFPLDFDGTKKRKELVMVNIHVSNGSAGTWTATVYPNESPTLGGVSTLTAYTEDPLYSIYGPTPSPVDASTAADLVVLTAQFTADGTGVLETAHPLVGYRFPVYLTFIPVPSVLPGGLYYYPCELYAIDIGYIDWQEPAEGDP